MSFGKQSSKKLLNTYCQVSIVSNLLVICFSVSYIIIPVQSILLDLFGIILILSWLMNILLIYLDDKFLIKDSEHGKLLNRFTYYYLIFFIIGILLIMLSQLISNFLLIGELSFFLSILMYINLLLGLIGIALFGINLALKNLSYMEYRGVFKLE